MHNSFFKYMVIYDYLLINKTRRVFYKHYKLILLIINVIFTKEHFHYILQKFLAFDV